MAKWRALGEYTPFARLLVEYMWEQRPPLLPNQFAARMGVRKQALSTWLNSDAVPSPPVLVRLARGMGRSVSDIMTAAGYASVDDPLLDRADAWAYVRAEVERALGERQEEGWAEAGNITAVAAEDLLALLLRLEKRSQPALTEVGVGVQGDDNDDAATPRALEDGEDDEERVTGGSYTD